MQETDEKKAVGGQFRWGPWGHTYVRASTWAWAWAWAWWGPGENRWVMAAYRYYLATSRPKLLGSRMQKRLREYTVVRVPAPNRMVRRLAAVRRRHTHSTPWDSPACTACGALPPGCLTEVAPCRRLPATPALPPSSRLPPSRANELGHEGYSEMGKMGGEKGGETRQTCSTVAGFQWRTVVLTRARCPAESVFNRAYRGCSSVCVRSASTVYMHLMYGSMECAWA